MELPEVAGQQSEVTVHPAASTAHARHTEARQFTPLPPATAQQSPVVEQVVPSARQRLQVPARHLSGGVPHWQQSSAVVQALPGSRQTVAQPQALPAVPQRFCTS